MTIAQQLRVLVDNAPPDEVTPKVMEQAIAPVLKVFAGQLKHLEYYVLQTMDQGWVLTTLSNRAKPQQEKRVIYAFSTLKDAAQFQGTSDSQIVALPVPVTHILFQMFALNQVDSAVFMETPGDLATGKEVRRADIQLLVQTQLQQLGLVPNPPSNIPPNLA